MKKTTTFYYKQKLKRGRARPFPIATARTSFGSLPSLVNVFHPHSEHLRWEI